MASTWGGFLQAANLQRPDGIHGTDMSVEQAIALLEAASAARGAVVEQLEVEDPGGYPTDLRTPADLEEFDHPEDIYRIIQRVRFADGSDHVLTISPHGITARPLLKGPEAPATKASVRVQEMYDLYGMTPREHRAPIQARSRLHSGVLIGMVFPFVLVFTAELSLFVLWIPIVLAIAGGVKIWPWITRNLPDPPTDWLTHRTTKTAPVAVVIGATTFYIGASIVTTLLFMGLG